MRKITEGERRMRLFDCDFCGAPAGMACTRPSGLNAAAHASRFEQATEAGMLPLDAAQARPSSPARDGA